MSLCWNAFLFAVVCVGFDVLCARKSVFDFLFCDSHADDDIFVFLSFSSRFCSCVWQCVLTLEMRCFFSNVHKLNIGKFWTVSNARCYNNRFQLSWQIHSMRLKTPQIRKTIVSSAFLFSFDSSDLCSALWDWFTQSSMRINFGCVISAN